jgi:hypothetical protein
VQPTLPAVAARVLGSSAGRGHRHDVAAREDGRKVRLPTLLRGALLVRVVPQVIDLVQASDGMAKHQLGRAGAIDVGDAGHLACRCGFAWLGSCRSGHVRARR